MAREGSWQGRHPSRGRNARLSIFLTMHGVTLRPYLHMVFPKKRIVLCRLVVLRSTATRVVARSGIRAGVHALVFERSYARRRAMWLPASSVVETTSPISPTTILTGQCEPPHAPKLSPYNLENDACSAVSVAFSSSINSVTKTINRGRIPSTDGCSIQDALQHRRRHLLFVVPAG